MKFLGITLILGLLAGAWAQTNVVQLQCDSPEAEKAALVAQDFLNAQHIHGYKYALNRIEDIKILTKLNGDVTYVLEVELLETDCHVLDPTPLENCTVRPKILTAIEGDCDVVLKKAGGALTVTAFKCKTDESREDLCLGCARLLPLNYPTALDFVHASLGTLNKITPDTHFAILEVGRMSSQVVSGGPIYSAEYVVVEGNCTDDVCVPLRDATAALGICAARGFSTDHTVDCKMFSALVPVPDGNSIVPDFKSIVPNANSTVADGNSTVADDIIVVDGNSTVVDGNNTVADDNSIVGDNSTVADDNSIVVDNSTVADVKSIVVDDNSTVADVKSIVVDGTSTAAPALPSVVHVHIGSPSPKHGLSHHKLTAFHNPQLSDLLSAESAESAEVVPEAPAVVAANPAADAGALSESSTSAEDHLILKRDVSDASASSVVETMLTPQDPLKLVPVCPGKIRFF